MTEYELLEELYDNLKSKGLSDKEISNLLKSFAGDIDYGNWGSVWYD